MTRIATVLTKKNLGLFFVAALDRTEAFHLAFAKLQIYLFNFKYKKRTLIQPQRTD